jgi:hypothetical protein
VSITNLINTIANAGRDTIISTTAGFVLTGNTPSAGNAGNWSVVSRPEQSNPVINTPESSVTLINGLDKEGEYTFRWTMTNSDFSNFDEVKVTVISILPVRLISFKAVEYNNVVGLNWQTASEDDNDFFEIQRSMDGSRFEIIGKKAGKGNSNSITDYSFTNDISMLASNVVYYRLRQVDRNGQSSFSETVKIKRQNSSKFSVFPNPFSSILNLEITTSEKGEATISIYLSNGQMVQKNSVKLVEGTNKISIQGSESLPAGVLTLLVLTGEKAYYHQVIKQPK